MYAVGITAVKYIGYLGVSPLSSDGISADLDISDTIQESLGCVIVPKYTLTSPTNPPPSSTPPNISSSSIWATMPLGLSCFHAM